MQGCNENSEPKTPAKVFDSRAWEMAIVALGKDAPVEELVKRAQEIQEIL